MTQEQAFIFLINKINKFNKKIQNRNLSDAYLKLYKQDIERSKNLLDAMTVTVEVA